MKILYMLGAYKPRASANGICSDNVLQELIKQGNEVTVIANRLFDCPKYSEEDGLKVYRIKPRFSYWLADWSKMHNNKLALKVAAIINKLKLMAMSSTWPLVSPLYTYRFYKKAVALYKKEHFDKVIAVYTPIDSLLAGYLLKRKYQEVKFVPYYLDALTGGWGPNKWSYKKKDKRTKKWEILIDKYADVIISMNSSRKYHEKNPLEGIDIEKRCFLDVPLMRIHKESLDFEEASNPHSKTLIFAGDISYPRRDPKPILEILSLVCLKTDVEVLFVGECNKPSIFQPYIEKTDGKIKYLGYQSHDKVIEMERSANCLVNIGSTNSNTISGKIFEYMTFLKPIISTFSIENEPGIKYLEKYEPVLLVDEKEDWQYSANQIIKFLNTAEQSKIEKDTLVDLFYDNTPKAFWDVIDNLM